MTMEARVRLWMNKSWDWDGTDDRMIYVGLMWAFDQVARVSEYTSAETGAENHCIRVWQLSFVLAGTEGKPGRVVAGARLAHEVSEESKRDVIACEVEASSHKGGALSKKKVIGRRSAQESQWLDDLVTWLLMTKLEAEDQIFTRYKSKTVGGKVFKCRLSAEMIRKAVKDMATAAGLPPDRFSSRHILFGKVECRR